MNNKLYWIIRDWWLKISFRLKKCWFSIALKCYNKKRTRNFSLLILKTIIIQSIKASAICLIALFLDQNLMRITKQETLRHEMFLNIVIGGIGVAGVILGLYCSNMASTFSSKYTNAPESINKLYQQDIVTNKCVKQIIGYITLCICILAICIAEISFNFIIVFFLLILTIRTIVTFSVSGNRAYDLSNTYRISDLIYPDIIHIIDKLISQGIIDSDKNFQNHYRKISNEYIGVLKDIATYNKSNTDNQTAPIITFLQNNFSVLFYYTKKKPAIPYNSLWFADKTRYQQWHTASDSEISTKIKFGLMLDTKSVRDYTWFESEFEKVNEICLDMLLKAKDYSSIYNYFVILSHAPDEISDYDSIVYCCQYVRSLKKKILPIISEKQDVADVDDKVAGIADAYAAVCFNIVMSICKYINKLDINSIFNYATSIERYSDITLKKARYLNNELAESFYRKIETEIRIEKHRITPSWYIEQFVAQKVYDHINLLSSQMTNVLEYAASIGEELLSKKCYYNAAIWFCRLSEMDAKITNRQVYEKLIAIESILLTKKKDPQIIWNDSSINQSIETMKSISQTIPQSLKKCSGIFALTHQDDRTEFPDLLGYCYNRICDCLISAIANNDYPLFKSLYNGFLGTMLLYQEYIRTDVIKRKEEHLQRAVLHVFSAPTLEFAMISGLAILWGEFVGSHEWRETVEEEIKPYTNKSDPEKSSVLQRIVQIISARKGSLIGLGNRDIIEAGWEQRISAAIQNHPNYNTKHGKYGEEYIVSNSKIFTAFTRHSLSLGILHDTEDVFCVLCINPYVQEDDKYHTRSKWEEIINEDEE